jgi:cell division protein FtsQ
VDRPTDAAGAGHSYRRGCILVLAVVLLYAGWVETMSQMKDTERFALVALEVNGIRILDGDDVLDASGLRVGDNIFAVDLDSVATRLQSLVWVRTARVERKPPDRLVVWLDERRRDAWIDIGERMFGVDEDGVLLPEQATPAETSQDLDLPVIRDLPVGEGKAAAEARGKLAVGDVVADSTLTAILEWWCLVREQNDGFSRQISELRPFGTSDLTVMLVGDGLEVRLPLQTDDVGQHLQTLSSVLPFLYEELPSPGYVDLRFKDQLVVGQPRKLPPVRRQTVPRSIKSIGREQVTPARAQGDHRG